MEKNRCDNEMEVFNAKVNKDEMIISIEEYEKMKKELACALEKVSLFEQIRHDTYREMSELRLKMEKAENENYLLRNGITNFIKAIGGNN